MHKRDVVIENGKEAICYLEFRPTIHRNCIARRTNERTNMEWRTSNGNHTLHPKSISTCQIILPHFFEILTQVSLFKSLAPIFASK
jgi:hypothetical protein